MASLGDEVGTEGVLSCPSVAWDFGDGPALIQDRDCSSEQQRAFSIRHSYAAPGVYEATARILGADIEASAPVQILVQGATPTPLPEGVLGFPPAVVTSQAAEAEKGAGASGGDPGATATALAVLAGLEAALELNTRPLAGELPAGVLVLPELPGVGGPGGSEVLWRLGTDGRTVTAAPVVYAASRDGSRRVVSAFSASPSGVVALAEGGRGRSAVLPGGAVFELGGAADGEFERLTLSEEGGVLASAWSRGAGTGSPDSLVVEAVAPSEPTTPEATGVGAAPMTPEPTRAVNSGALEQAAPLAWDRSGTRLLVRLPLGEAAVLDIDTGEVSSLPVRGGAEGGWLFTRPGGESDVAESVVWLAGPGLRLLTLGDSLQQTTLLEDASVSSVRQADDGALLALVGQGGRQQLVRFNLARDELEPVPVGEPFVVESGEIALPAPDGLGVLIYGPSGARYLDHRAREHWLMRAPVRQAEWDPVRG